ncbi:glycosyltransferase family 1 protein [Streptomyces phaeolivaceus]|uniref:Glycosyltransferase family 1 protein n=1 Tax=Streptomyces phaeolivaceus TaxID=2653200 RepID=A0A5P8K1D1_9ACTN|nr:glycosyltransferase [Streptomyces phaeolivaceus]QFQ97055.1 glycosyltransferase family 1 protein [Streptomyces phaeolivaceus]
MPNESGPESLPESLGISAHPRKILLAACGTRGDVQPFLALAVALRRHGHHPLLAAPSSYASDASVYGVDFAAIDDGPTRILGETATRRVIDNGLMGVRGKIDAARTVARLKQLLIAPLRDVAAIAHDHGDVAAVVHSAAFPAQHVADMLDVPAVVVALQPGWIPTDAFPCPLMPLPRVPRFLNRGTYALVVAAQRSREVERWRTTELGLAPRRHGARRWLRDPEGRRRAVLQSFSRHVTPVDPTWGDAVRTTGFWYLPARPDWAPPPELTRFLDEGPPPVYIGFGSMTGTQGRRNNALIAEAVRLTGVRAVIATGWGGIDAPEGQPTRPASSTTSTCSTTSTSPPSNILAIEQAPHDWLFPRTAAIVHHGGPGTVGAALAAGRPQVLCPHMGDQTHWSARMRALGVAPTPLAARTLTARGLAEAITAAVTDRHLRQRAEEIAPVVRAEDGVDTAVNSLLAHITSSARHLRLPPTSHEQKAPECCKSRSPKPPSNQGP